MAANTNKKRRFHGFRFLTILLVIAVGFELVAGLVGILGLQTFLKDKPELDVEDFLTQESTLIYDKNGTLIADVGVQLRENIEYDQIPEAMIDAFLSIEDSRYFTHNGFDVPRFSKAVLETLLHGNMQGGSTFTMQLVKMTYFVDDENGTSRTKDIEYKIQQIALAIELEEQLTKKEIFEMYLNKMNFGGYGNIRGVQKASQQYFDKDVSELSVSECAVLAGVVNSPFYYDPHRYLDHATDRRNDVLYQMHYHGYINDEEYALALSVKVEDLLVDPFRDDGDDETYQYQAYIDEVIKEAEKVTGNDPLTVSMEIYTCMDPTAQDMVESILAEETDVQFFDELVECAIISENNQTGEIVAIGGGRNYAAGGSMLLNHATEQWNQPGSSIKPITDYILAFEYLGWATSHVVTDRPVALGYHVFQNAGSQGYHGQVTLQKALGLSLNTPAIQALQDVIDKVGLETVLNYYESLHFERFDRDSFDIQYAIGAGSFQVSAKELMAAHAIVMNGGNYITPHTITRISYRVGSAPDYEANFAHEQVVSPQSAYLISTLLESNVSINWWNYMQLLARSYPVYAKTGTTDWGDAGLQYGIPFGASKESWMVAQTSHYTTAVWLGYEKAIEGEDCYIDSWKGEMNITGNINSIMLDTLNEEEWPDAVPMPDGISSITHILGLFPYVSPISGMDSSYVTTGLIKSEYATLETPEAAAQLSSLSSFNASIDSDYKVSYSWAVYPDEKMLEEASSSMDLSLRDANGNLLASASGARMFDYSWIYGAVAYKARIMQNGQTIKEFSSESDTDSETLYDELAENTETQVCGYYGYTKQEDNVSNEICTTFTTPLKKVTAPNSNATTEEINAWVKKWNLSITVVKEQATEEHPDGTKTLEQDGKNVWNTVIDRNKKLTLTIYTNDPLE